MISFAVTAKLICAFVFAEAIIPFSHDAAQLTKDNTIRAFLRTNHLTASMYSEYLVLSSYFFLFFHEYITLCQIANIHSWLQKSIFKLLFQLNFIAENPEMEHEFKPEFVSQSNGAGSLYSSQSSTYALFSLINLVLPYL